MGVVVSKPPPSEAFKAHVNIHPLALEAAPDIAHTTDLHDCNAHLGSVKQINLAQAGFSVDGDVARDGIEKIETESKVEPFLSRAGIFKHFESEPFLSRVGIFKHSESEPFLSRVGIFKHFESEPFLSRVGIFKNFELEPYLSRVGIFKHFELEPYLSRAVA